MLEGSCHAVMLFNVHVFANVFSRLRNMHCVLLDDDDAFKCKWQPNSFCANIRFDNMSNLKLFWLRCRRSMWIHTLCIKLLSTTTVYFGLRLFCTSGKVLLYGIWYRLLWFMRIRAYVSRWKNSRQSRDGCIWDHWLFALAKKAFVVDRLRFTIYFHGGCLPRSLKCREKFRISYNTLYTSPRLPIPPSPTKKHTNLEPLKPCSVDYPVDFTFQECRPR